MATDLGHFNQYTVDHLLDLDAVLLESNHDLLRMLETGPYPYYSKAPHHGGFRTSFQRKRRTSLELHFERQIETYITRPSEQGEQYSGAGV